MKNTLLLLLGASALSLASCSQEKTADATTTTTVPADGTATTTVSDATYKSRGTRMADKFASDMKISDEPTKEKLRTAYYNRSKRYDDLMAKYKADTAGYATARRDYNSATDQEFQTILLVPAQYQSYQSSRPTYDEANNLDTADQTAGAASATMPSDSSSSMSGSTTTNSTATTEEAPTSTMSGANVAKGKTKMTDGSKMKVKNDGTVKVKDGAGNKTKM